MIQQQQKEQQQQHQFQYIIKNRFSRRRRVTTNKCSLKNCQLCTMMVLHLLVLSCLISILCHDKTNVESLVFINNTFQKKQYCHQRTFVLTKNTPQTTITPPSTTFILKNIPSNKGISQNNRKQSTSLFSLSRIMQLDEMKCYRHKDNSKSTIIFLSSINDNDNDNDIDESSSESNTSNIQGMATFLSNRLGWVIVRTIQQKQQDSQQQQQSISEIKSNNCIADNIENDVTVSTAIPEMEDITLDSITSTISSSSSSDTVFESNTSSITDATTTTDDDNDVDQSSSSNTSSLSQPESPLYVPNIPSVISLGHGKALSVTESNVVALREDK